MGRKRANVIIDRPKTDDYAIKFFTGKVKAISVYQGYIDGIHEFATVQKSRAGSREPQDTNLWDHMIKHATPYETLIFDVPEGKKWCSNCGDWVNRAGFSPDKRNKDGLHVWCKTCRADHAQKMYWATKKAA